MTDAHDPHEAALARWPRKHSATHWASSSKATDPRCARPTPAKCSPATIRRGYGRGSFGFGQYSDDTQLARELALSLATGRFVPEDFAARVAALFATEKDRRAWPGDRGGGAPAHRRHPVGSRGQAVAECWQRGGHARGARRVPVRQPSPDDPHRRRFGPRHASRQAVSRRGGPRRTRRQRRDPPTARPRARPPGSRVSRVPSTRRISCSPTASARCPSGSAPTP